MPPEEDPLYISVHARTANVPHFSVHPVSVSTLMSLCKMPQAGSGPVLWQVVGNSIPINPCVPWHPCQLYCL
jgi:hypothetical protein